MQPTNNKNHDNKKNMIFENVKDRVLFLQINSSYASDK